MKYLTSILINLNKLSMIVIKRHIGPLAQSVEQRTFNPWVVGSIPTGPTFCVQEIF